MFESINSLFSGVFKHNDRNSKANISVQEHAMYSSFETNKNGAAYSFKVMINGLQVLINPFMFLLASLTAVKADTLFYFSTKNQQSNYALWLREIYPNFYYDTLVNTVSSALSRSFYNVTQSIQSIDYGAKIASFCTEYQQLTPILPNRKPTYVPVSVIDLFAGQNTSTQITPEVNDVINSINEQCASTASSATVNYFFIAVGAFVGLCCCLCLLSMLRRSYFSGNSMENNRQSQHQSRYRLLSSTTSNAADVGINQTTSSTINAAP